MLGAANAQVASTQEASTQPAAQAQSVALPGEATSAPSSSAVDAAATQATTQPSATTKPAAKTAAQIRDAARKLREQDEKRRSLNRRIMMSKLRLDQTRLNLEFDELGRKESMQRLEEELKLARDALTTFINHDRPMRLRNNQLSLQSSQDRLDEQAEELAQLELMYAEEDLADKTKDIVLNRSRRRLERAREYRKIQLEEVAKAETIDLPLQEQSLRRAVLNKELEIERQRRSARQADLSARISLLEAEQAVTSAEDELTKFEQDLADERAKEMESAGKEGT